MTGLRVVLGVAMLALSASPVLALGISGTDGFGFDTDPGLPNSNGSPYWDQKSIDGTNMNIGFFLSGTGAFAGNPNSPNLGTPLSSWQSLGPPLKGKADLAVTFTQGSDPAEQSSPSTRGGWVGEYQRVRLVPDRSGSEQSSETATRFSSEGRTPVRLGGV